MMKRTFTTRRGLRMAVAGALLAAGFAGCDAFSPETEPLGQLTSENFFETSEQAVQATNATYNMLRQWPVHVFSWIGMTDIVSDESTKGSVPADASFLLDLDDLNFDPGNIAFSTVWGGYYQGIYRANVAIQNIPDVPEMDEALRARLIGENQFLRAYFYFFLVRAFGGVPLITEPFQSNDDFERQRASAEEIYTLIEQDLTEAIAALPVQSEYGGADVGRASKGAAQALLAEVHLYQEDYQNAFQNAQDVITSGEYSLYPSYSELFSPAGENSSESVFEVQAVALEQGGTGSQYSQVQGVRGTPNLGWGFNTPSDMLEGHYEPGDPRLQATILYPWELLPDGSGAVVYINPSMPNNRYNQKPFTSPDTPGGQGNSGVNIRRIRYADVLLIAAEAAYQLGNTAEAQDYLNQVRERARGEQSVTLGFTPERLAEPIASGVLGLGGGDTRVFARYVNPSSPAADAGLRGFEAACGGDCAPADPPPVVVSNVDLIQSVNGTAVTTPEDVAAVVSGLGVGQSATLEVLRAARSEGGEVSTETLTLDVEVQELLPDVTASGQTLLDAIWQERESELALEQQRWFDIIRQGRAAEVMAAAGKNFIEGTHELYPIPSGEVELVGLQQNPGYN
ncbi:MAG: RagB/SusD family nutrient uptake outer membrane protein [Rhodothermales bacterium]